MRGRGGGRHGPAAGDDPDKHPHPKAQRQTQNSRPSDRRSSSSRRRSSSSSSSRPSTDGVPDPDEAPPVVVCGGVRYLDIGWDPTGGRALDTHATQAMADLAGRLFPPSSPQPPNALQAWAAMLAALPGRIASLPGLVASQAVAAHSAVVSTWQRIAAVATASSQVLSDASFRRMRALADLHSRPLTLATHPASTDGDSGDSDSGVVPAPDRLPPRWRRWRPRAGRGRGRRSSRTSADVDEPRYGPADFLFPAATTGTTIPDRPRVDALLIIEDVQSWSAANTKASIPRRRAALSDLVSKARAGGATPVLVIAVPSAPDGSVSRFPQWVEQVAQIKAAYGLPAGVQVVAVPGGGEVSVHSAPKGPGTLHAAAISVHNAVASALLGGGQSESSREQQLSSKL
jgi:hypothetical protein